jgi:hypothetical protein
VALSWSANYFRDLASQSGADLLGNVEARQAPRHSGEMQVDVVSALGLSSATTKLSGPSK